MVLSEQPSIFLADRKVSSNSVFSFSLRSSLLAFLLISYFASTSFIELFTSFNCSSLSTSFIPLTMSFSISSVAIYISYFDYTRTNIRIISQTINDNLEAMAHQLYDYWFVQFDFPDENGRPYKSSGGMMVWNETLKQEIPNGWYVSNICKVAEILSGGTPSKAITKYWDKGTIPFFGPTDCNGNIYQLQTKDHITEEGLKHCASSLYEDGTIFITARGSIGKLVIAGTSMAMNQSCYALRSKTGEYEYLFFLTQQLIEWLKAKGNGSVFKSIISSDIEASSLCIGRENIIALYCKRVKPIFKKIKANSQEILSLIKQRDELLPLLMNGQATVNYHLSLAHITPTTLAPLCTP